jgi:glutamate dehydrogenase/leucine dehydrogenase
MDLLAPCALGGVIGLADMPRLRCQIVVRGVARRIDPAVQRTGAILSRAVVADLVPLDLATAAATTRLAGRVAVAA